MRSDAINLLNKRFGKLVAVGRNNGTGKWICRCDCGNIREVRSYDLRKGNAKMCKECGLKHASVSKLIDLTGEKFGEWEVLNYVGNKKWRCKCSCGYIGEVFTNNLVRGKSKSCENCVGKRKAYDIENKRFGKLVPIEYIGGSLWKCKCDCGNYENVLSYKLTSGEIFACSKCQLNGHIKDISGMQFGEWKVIEYVGELKWKCRCSCGKIANIHGYNLRSGHSTSCGHGLFIDLTGRQINEWKVLKYLGKYKWLCQCSCGNIKEVHGYELRTNQAKSCGCKKWEYTKDTLLHRYGEVSPLKIGDPRTIEQIQAVDSRENLINVINEFKTKPTSIDLSKRLGIQVHRTLCYVHKYGLDDYINLFPSISAPEKEIYSYIKSITDCEIIQSDRKILNGRELDIYIPDKKLAIEFNGVYWHSSAIKSKDYHQNKTIECAKQGIRLIHIFEYEWADVIKREKIINILNSALNKNSKVIYAKNIEIKHIEKEESDIFLEQYHLQGSSASSIRIGAFNGDELIGVMTLGKPRFNNEFEYELIRLAWKPEINVVGGFEKLFKHFIVEYNPNSVISYCDISKFTGNSYTRVGFKVNKDGITSPNYVWVNPIDMEILSRYQTQKNKLLDAGLGVYGDTEDEIMENIGYLKVYDAGNLRIAWCK